VNTAQSPSDQPPDHPAQGLEGQLAQYLLAAQPARVIIVGEPPIAPWWHEPAAEGTPQVHSFATLAQCLSDLPADEQSEAGEQTGHCAALMNFDADPEASADRDLAAELGQAVRRFPDRLIISVETNEPDDAAFFAFGFRRLQLGDQRSIRLFEYCLSEYKQAPDWLNARYWANPERYGLTDDHDSYSEDGEDDEEE